LSGKRRYLCWEKMESDAYYDYCSTSGWDFKNTLPILHCFSLGNSVGFVEVACPVAKRNGFNAPKRMMWSGKMPVC